MPLGCNPFESFQPLAARHAGAGSLNARHSVFEYCCDERDLGEEQSRSAAQEVRRDIDAVVGDRGVIPGLEMAYVSVPIHSSTPVEAELQHRS